MFWSKNLALPTKSSQYFYFTILPSFWVSFRPDLNLLKNKVIKIVPYTGFGRNTDYTLELQLSLDDVAGLGAEDKEKIELLDYFLNFLNTDGELNHVLAGYLSKFLILLLNKSQKTVNKI